MKETLTRKVYMVMLAALLMNVSPAFAKTMTFTKEYTYQASEADSKLSCRAIALEQVKRLLLEEIGMYLESQTEVKDFQLTKNQITALTAGIVSTDVKEEKWDGKTYWLKAQIIADPDDVAKTVDNLRNDHEKTQALYESRRKAEEASREIEKLNKEITALKGQADTRRIQKYNKTVNRLTSIDWYEKGWFYIFTERYDKAIDALDKALERDPNDAAAYFSRGLAKFTIGQLQNAIDDFTKAIELEPSMPPFYTRRGADYVILGQCDKALNDADQAILLDEKFGEAIFVEGLAFHCKALKAEKEGNDHDRNMYWFFARGALLKAANFGHEGAQKLCEEWGITWKGIKPHPLPSK